jgi:hypothetical protein
MVTVAQWNRYTEAGKGRYVMVGEQGHWGMPVSKSLEEAAVQEFAANLRGKLLRPEDDGYDATRAVFNGRQLFGSSGKRQVRIERYL